MDTMRNATMERTVLEVSEPSRSGERMIKTVEPGEKFHWWKD